LLDVKVGRSRMPASTHLVRRINQLPARRIGAARLGALAAGALAIGAVALGAVALGRLAIGRMVVGKARFREVEIDRLTVRQLRVLEPAGRSGQRPSNPGA
jgi:hypothetical protein